MKHTFIRLLCAALAAVMLLACAGTGLAEAGPKKVTVMVYLCGSTLEGHMGHFQGSETIDQIIASQYNKDEVNVIALLGGTKKWSTGYDPGVLTLLDVGGGRRGRPKELETWDLASMGDADTLSRFVNYCHDNYPAEEYVLVLWDHGGGPIYGIFEDVLFNYDGMDMHELCAALDATPFAAGERLDVLAFNACLMGSAEISTMMAPYAKYMVATEDSMYGLDYSWISGVENDASALDTAKRITDGTFDNNAAIIERQNATEINSVAVFDLDAVSALIPALDGFFADVTVDPEDDIAFTAMSKQRRDAVSFGLGASGEKSSFDLVDLGGLVKGYSDMNSAAADAVQQAIEAAIPYYRAQMDGCYGLTVYHPFLNKDKDMMADRIAVYTTLGFSEKYTDYLLAFSAVLAGKPLADWRDLVTSLPAASKDNRTLFNVALSEDQAAHYGDSEMAVLLKAEDDTYAFTFVNDNIVMDERSNLVGDFNNSALYAVDAEGNALTAPLEYSLAANGAYLVPAALTIKGQDGEEDETAKALIVCTLDTATKQLTPGAVQIYMESMGGYTGIYNTTLADYDEIALTVASRVQTRDENGVLLAFSDWDVAGTQDWTFPIDDSWRFQILNDTLDGTQLYATFQVADSQNYVYSSEPLVVKAGVPEPGPIRVEYDDANLVLISTMSIAPASDMVLISGQVKNLSDKEAFVTVENLTLNGAPCAATTEAVGNGENWGLLPQEESAFSLSLTADDLADIDVLTDITFDLTLVDAVTEEIIGTVPVVGTLYMELGANG